MIDGTWNFKSVTTAYTDEYVISHDLQMENVTGSIKQTRGVPDADETIKLNFVVKSLNLHFANGTVRAEIQESEQNVIISTTLHNSSLILKTVIVEKIQRSIASFIQLSFYGIQHFVAQRKEEELLEQTVRETTRNGSLLQYDISSAFSKQFVSTLEDLRDATKKQVYRINNHHIQDANDIPDEMKRLNESTNHSISLNDVKISLDFPIAREETCSPLDHSQLQIAYNVTLKLKGMVTIIRNSSIALARVSFLVKARCTIITFKNGNMPNEEFQHDVVCEDMEVRIEYPTKNEYKSLTNEENDLKIKLKQISIEIIKTKLQEVQTWFSDDVINFCEIPHVVAANETYSDLLNDSQKYFHLSKNIVQETYPGTLIYHLRLYGIFNLKFLYLLVSEKETIFKFEVKNLTARIVWNYISDYFLSMEDETLDVQIEAIVLIGNIIENSGLPNFSDKCTLLLSPNQGNIEEQQTLTENLNRMVMSPIQGSIIGTYRKDIHTQAWYSADFITAPIKESSIVRDFYSGLLSDITDLEINSLFEMIVIFRQAFGRNLYEELFSQKQTMEIPSGMTNLENLQISFSIIRPANDMFFLYADDIECQPRNYLQVKLKQKNSEQVKMMKLTGNLKYPRLKNSTQRCQVNFSLEFEFLRIQVKFHHVNKNNTQETSTDLKVKEWNEHSCADIDEKQRWAIRQNALQAIIDHLETTLFTNSTLPFQSIRERCEQLLDGFNETERDLLEILGTPNPATLPWKTKKNDSNETPKYVYYVHFRSGYNAATFPWQTKKIDITIRGLHDFTFHMRHFEDAVQYKIEFPRTSIEWEINSIVTKYFISKSQHITMNGTFRDFTDNTINIKLPESQLHMKDGYNNIAATTEQIKNLEALIVHGIVQELRNDEQRDVTENARAIISKILYEFAKQTFENPFHDDWKKAIHVFNIKSNLHRNSEYMNCSFNNSLQIGVLGYKKITAQVNLQYQTSNEAMKEVSTYVEMKNFNSTPYNLLLDTKELEIEIERNLNASKKTITILSTYRYERRDRIAIGKAAYELFEKEMKERIFSVAKSIRPISNLCKDPMNSFRRLYSNYPKNHKKYYISFPADWIDIVYPFTNRYVKIIINGTWNFKSINTRYINEVPVISNIRVENITGSIKQIDAFDPGPAVQLNFIIKCLWIQTYTNFTKKIRAKVPNSKQFFIASTTPYSNSSSIPTNVIIEKFQESIASFIERSPFGYLDWHKRVIQDFNNQTATEATWNGSLPQYDISSLFSEKFAETLDSLQSHLKKQGYQINKQHLKDSNKIPSEMKRLNESLNHFISLNGVKISSSTPIAYEVTCEPPNHTKIAYNITLRLTGTATITNDSNFVLANISFLSSTHSTIIPFKYASNAKFRFEIACENMEVQLKHLSEKIYKYAENEKIDLKNKLKLISIAIIKTKSSETFQSWFQNDAVINFCELPHIIAANTTYSDLLSDSRRYFYPINESLPLNIYKWTIIYQINLYGLFNFNSFKMQYSENETTFEFQAKNLTARMAWKRNQDPTVSLKVEKMDVEIEAIVLRGKIITLNDRLHLSRESTFRLSPNQGNIEERQTLTENLNAVVMYCFQKSIRTEFQKRHKSLNFRNNPLQDRPDFDVSIEKSNSVDPESPDSEY